MEKFLFIARVDTWTRVAGTIINKETLKKEELLKPIPLRFITSQMEFWK